MLQSVLWGKTMQEKKFGEPILTNLRDIQVATWKVPCVSPKLAIAPTAPQVLAYPGVTCEFLIKGSKST